MTQRPLYRLDGADGEALELVAGRHVLGSGQEAGLRVEGLEAQHLVVTITAERVFCQVRRPGQRFAVNGEETESRALVDGDRLAVGAVAWTLRRLSAEASTAELIRARGEQSTFEQHYERLRASGDAPSVHQLDLLYRLARLVNTVDDTAHFQRELLSLVLGAIPAKRAFLLGLAEEGQDVVVAAAPAERAKPGPSQTIVRRVMAEGVSLITTDAPRDPRLLDAQSIVVSAIHTALCAPLHDGDTLLGALYVDSPDGGAPLGAEDLTMLESIASFAGVALGRARAHQALRQRELHAHLLVHDLKNPLSNVLAAADYLRLLLPPDSAVDLTELFELIKQAGRRLEGYISDILDVAQLDEAGVRPQREEIELETFAAALRERWQTILGLRRLKLEVTVEPPAARFSFDRHLIDRVLDNLLDNAVQHAPTESRIDVRLEQKDDELQVVVADQGAGVPLAMREKIFEKFGRAEVKAGAGRGFGLYFCRLAVAAHGGCIGVSGEPRDNRFVFTLAAGGAGSA